MKHSTKLRRQAAAWGLILALWALLVLAFSGALVLVRDLPWSDAFQVSLRNWYPWVLLAPVVAWLGFRFPFEWGRLKSSIPIHLAGCLASALVMALMVGPPPNRLNPLPGQPPRPLNAPAPRFDENQRPALRNPSGGRPPLNQPGNQWSPPESLPQPPFPPFPNRAPLPPRNLFLNALLLHAQMSIPVYWVIVSIVQALRFYYRSQEREKKAAELEARLAQAKLEALHLQLQPHFLFNTLNAISMLVHKNPDAADEMIANLSELLRASLDTKETEIPLARELELLNKYLAIQQVRFADRLRIERQFDAAALQELVPALILQPLAENAIRHGLEPRAGTGLLEIRATRQDGFLRIRVRDDGIGSASPGGDVPGIGIANSRDRLRELYGDAAQLVLSSASQGGFTAEVIIPLRAGNPPGPPS